jgi:hypothetical protein
MRALVAMVVLVPGLALAQAPGKLAVMPLKATRLSPEVVGLLDELLIGEIAQRSPSQVIGASDINAMLGLEKMKEAVGCDDIACAAELGGALGVDHLVAGTIGELGGELLLNLKLIDVAHQTVQARASINSAAKESLYRQAIQNAVVQLFGGAPTQVLEGASPANTVVADLSSPMFKRFELAGLDRTTYLDYVASGLSYSTWAHRFNDDSESLALDVTKWTFTGTAALVLSVMLMTRGADESLGSRIAVSMPMVLSAGACWGLDLYDYGNAPDPLPDL